MVRGGVVLALLSVLTLVQLGMLDCCAPPTHAAHVHGQDVSLNHASSCGAPSGCNCAHALGGEPLWFPLQGVTLSPPEEGDCTRPMPLFFWRTPPG